MSEKGRPWTKEEDEYIEARAGWVKASSIGKEIDRTPLSIKNRMKQLGCGNTLMQDGRITAVELAKGLGVYYGKVMRWIKEHNLPAVQKATRETRKFWRIDVEKFWGWAEQNKDLIDFSRLDSLALLPHPEWVEMEQRADFRENPRRAFKAWTPEEENKLINLVKTDTPVKVIAEQLKRTEVTIVKRISVLRKKGALDSLRHIVPWTTEEVDYLLKELASGTKHADIAENLGRDSRHVTQKAYTLRKKGLIA